MINGVVGQSAAMLETQPQLRPGNNAFLKRFITISEH